ncbi:MAG: XRE family transcriptional regulator [Clostridia bacterium]|nr:XRE family transcriptional regulator [Clostridia bacterium]
MFVSERFAYNIKYHRKRLGLTQKELAEKLFLSPQNISKWEKGSCAPDIENLCRLAEVLGVSLDSLVGEGESTRNESCYIAVDGGGTKTEFLLFTESGEVRARAVLPASNPNSVTVGGTYEVLRNGIDEMLKYTANISGLYAGIAGCGNAGNRKEVTRLLRKNYPAIKFEISSDIMNVFGSCPALCGDSIAVICGTGSVVYAKNESGLHQCGGWGYLFDRAGSGFDIGCDAIRAALANVDGLMGESLVTKYVEETLGTNAKESIHILYAKGRDYIASFASCVFRAALEGDETALAIIERNTDRLATLINFTAKTYNCRNGIILSGGIAKDKELFGDRIQAKIDSDLKIIYTDIPQVIGAARVCLETFSGSLASEAFTDKLTDGYNIAVNKEQ